MHPARLPAGVSKVNEQEVDNAFQQAKKLMVAKLVRSLSVPVDALRGRAVKFQLGGVIGRDLRQDRGLRDIGHRGAPASCRGACPCGLR